MISVKCKSHVGELHCNRYFSGIRGQCIRYKDKWLTPQEFGTTCGGANGRKYLEIIQTDYGPLGALTKSGTLTDLAGVLVSGAERGGRGERRFIESLTDKFILSPVERWGKCYRPTNIYIYCNIQSRYPAS